jgi:D-amino-acid dehydrogenase
MTRTEKQDVTIIGAGIVGTVCASYLLREGHSVTMIDPREPGSMTSFGNTGGISPASVAPISMPGILYDVPKWLFDPLGPLYIRWSHLPTCLPWLIKFLRAGSRKRVKDISRALTALNMPTFDAYEPLLKWAKLEHLFYRTGQLFVYRTEKGFAKDSFSIALKRETGVRVDILGKSELQEFEPTLAPIFARAYYIEAHGHCKDPFRLVQGLAEQFVRQGGTILREAVRCFEFGSNGPTAIITEGGQRKTGVVVIAAGVWSSSLVRQLGYIVPLESHRGYHVTMPAPGIMPKRMVLSMEDKVAITPMNVGLRFAGTVELAGIEAPPNYARARRLLEVGQKVFPGLRTEGYTQWMGHRPCTPDSLPVIGRAPDFPNVYFAFGHGHQGLIGASKTGQVLAEMVGARQPSMDLEPFSVMRFKT